MASAGWLSHPEEGRRVALVQALDRNLESRFSGPAQSCLLSSCSEDSMGSLTTCGQPISLWADNRFLGPTALSQRH